MRIIHTSDGKPVYAGTAFAADLGAIAREHRLGGATALLITGVASFDRMPESAQLADTLAAADIAVAGRVRVAANPRLRHAEKVAAAFPAPDVLVAVGGGSAIDFAKLLEHRWYPRARLVVVYTLPGTGTIVSPFAVFDDDTFKVGVADPALVPDVAYVNEPIVDRLPAVRRWLAAADAFTHALESHLSAIATPDSRASARRALAALAERPLAELSADALVRADIDAGVAESQAVVLFPHAAGHHLTFAHGVPHAAATMTYLRPYLELVEARGGRVPDGGWELVGALESCLRGARLGLPRALPPAEAAVALALARAHMPFAFDNAPVELTDADYLRLLAGAA